MKLTRKQGSFNRLSLILVIAILLIMSGCGIPSVQKMESDQYTITPGRINNFYVVSSDLDPARKPRYVNYLFTGSIKNNTTNTYASAYLTMRVSIELQNGNVLEEKDLNDVTFNDILSHKSLENWKAEHTVEVSRLISISIPVEYADYPVKDVVVQYSAKLEDKINQTQEEDVIASVSVISKWKEAVRKVKAGKADADDGNFPAKILNGMAEGSLPGRMDRKEANE